jgi:hypothetical protein
MFFLLSESEFVESLVVSSTFENLASENQSSVSCSSVEKKESKNEKEVDFTSCSSVCFFVDSSIESLLVLVFSALELSFSILFV